MGYCRGFGQLGGVMGCMSPRAATSDVKVREGVSTNKMACIITVADLACHKPDLEKIVLKNRMAR